MTYPQYNKNFIATKDIPEELYYILIAEGRIILTTTRLTAQQAENILGPAEEPPYSEIGTYGGEIIVSSKENYKEAELIAQLRGWDEVIEGVLIDQIPEDEDPLGTNINLN